MIKTMMKVRVYDGYKIAEFIQKNHRIGMWLPNGWTYNPGDNEIVHFDLGNYIRVNQYGENMLKVEVVRMQFDSANNAHHSYRIVFYADEIEFRMITLGGGKGLFTDEMPIDTVEITESAQRQIRKLSDVERSALRKFLRDSFKWPGGKHIRIYADFGHDFGFYEEGGICGGIILSSYARNGYNETKYGMHT